jgi:hypothetical protein
MADVINAPGEVVVNDKKKRLLQQNRDYKFV